MFFILDQLINKNWVKNAYKIYYSDQEFELETIEEKANQCFKKYHEKIRNLQSRHTYYITEVVTPPILTAVSSID